MYLWLVLSFAVSVCVYMDWIRKQGAEAYASFTDEEATNDYVDVGKVTASTEAGSVKPNLWTDSGEHSRQTAVAAVAAQRASEAGEYEPVLHEDGELPAVMQRRTRQNVSNPVALYATVEDAGGAITTDHVVTGPTATSHIHPATASAPLQNTASTRIEAGLGGVVKVVITSEVALASIAGQEPVGARNTVASSTDLEPTREAASVPVPTTEAAEEAKAVKEAATKAVEEEAAMKVAEGAAAKTAQDRAAIVAAVEATNAAEETAARAAEEAPAKIAEDAATNAAQEAAAKAAEEEAAKAVEKAAAKAAEEAAAKAAEEAAAKAAEAAAAKAAEAAAAKAAEEAAAKAAEEAAAKAAEEAAAKAAVEEAARLAAAEMARIQADPHASAAAALEQVKQEMRNNKARVVDLFRSLDTDGSGSVTVDEFSKGLPSIGFDVSFKVGLDAFFAALDVDGSGSISYKELHKVLRVGLVEKAVLDPVLHEGAAGGIAAESSNAIPIMPPDAEQTRSDADVRAAKEEYEA
jgi:chemotaxis protein histidine kinase CheA